MTSYRHEDYQFDLPAELIAQHPPAQRDESRLMVAGPDGAAVHARFNQLPTWLQTGDVLVLNRTKVMNARGFARKQSGGRVETFFLDIQVAPDQVPVLVRPAKRVPVGTWLTFPNADVRAQVVDRQDQGRALLAFADREALLAAIAADGEVPLPPYIKRDQGPSAEDVARYQTVYAQDLGAVAAPTAGLHFTESLLADLAAMDVALCYLTHHVGIGTFKPLIVDDIRQHRMEAENYHIDAAAAALLNQAKTSGRRIIAVGTTSTRALEANFDSGFHAGTFRTNHFIYPGYSFRAIDGLVTNFHLPGSSLILLVSALMGRQRIMTLYAEAIALKYRFYSYGDAMLLKP